MAEGNFQYASQEVFALRRQGTHAEALKLAREAFGEEPGNEWNVRALAWCLYDEAKRLKAESDSEALAAVREELTGLKIPADDERLRDGVTRALGNDALGKASSLSKAGKHHEAVKLLRPIANAKEANQHDVEGYSWVLYRKLKDCEEHEHDVAIWCLNEFLECWSEEREPNAMLFRNLIIQAKLQAENWAGMIPLVERLGLHRFRPEEFADEQPNPDFPSFQDQLLSAIHKCLKKHPAMRGNRANLLLWLDAWRDSFGDEDSRGENWPEYHLGHILSWIGGDPDLASHLLLKTLQRKPDDYWRWQAYSESLKGGERKAALSRGICCPNDPPSYKIPLYAEYAEVLAEDGELSAAKASLDEAIRLRRLAGDEWKVPLPVWYEAAGAEPPVEIHDYALPLAKEAEKMLTFDLPSFLCVLLKDAKSEGCFLYYCDGLGVRNLRFAARAIPDGDTGAILAKFRDKPKGISDVLIWTGENIPKDLGDRVHGVVDHLNREKRFVSILLPEGGFVPLHFDRWEGTESLKTGDSIEIQLLTNTDWGSVILAWQPVAPKEIPGFLMSTQGVFRADRGKASGFLEGPKDRIFVHPLVAQHLRDAQKVSGWAVKAKKKDGVLSWKLLP